MVMHQGDQNAFKRQGVFVEKRRAMNKGLETVKQT
jgi:hypothetical protein